VSSTGLKEAIYIFSENSVTQGYWLTEFEQMIRNQRPIADYKDQVIKAVYVVIGAQDFAQALVLFNLPVNDRGYVESGWYLPFRRLADSAGHGPNMGDGRIRLACHSQCAISWHKEALWEPVTSDFMAVRKAIRDNLIGQQPTELNRADVQAPAVKVGTSRQIAGALSKRHQDPEVEQLKAELKAETLAYRSQLQQLQGEIERQKSLTEKAQRQVGEDDFSFQLEDAQQEVERLNQALAQQEKALVSQQEETARAQSELEALRAELTFAQEQGLHHFINKVESLEAVLVSYHPGAGHLTIAADNMQAYAENPRAYAAQKCSVEEDQYTAWLEHYDSPRCQSCNKALPRVEMPQDFNPRLQGFCQLHRTMKAPLAVKAP
jgi:hypothetical protein